MEGSGSETYLLLKSQLDSEWPDIEGKEYHFGTNVTNESKLVAKANVILERGIEGGTWVFLGHGTVASVQESGVGTSKIGKTFVRKIAYLKNYTRYEPPKTRTAEIEQLLEALPTYNRQNSIVTITKPMFEKISGLRENILPQILTIQQLEETETALL